jgi:glycosyl transferase family 1
VREAVRKWTSPSLGPSLFKGILRARPTNGSRGSAGELGRKLSQRLSSGWDEIIDGFGFPVVHAMAAGTPVITSDGSALPEIVGGAALLTSQGRNPSNDSTKIRLADGFRR